jgi:hypothetical protein
MNLMLITAAAVLSLVAVLRVGAALMQPILYLFPSSSGTSPQSPGRRRRR